MRAEYDSRARAVWIALGPEPPRGVPGGDTIDVARGCAVMLNADGQPYGVEILDPTSGLDELARAAERYGFDPQALEAAARAAIAAPDRVITLDVGEMAA